MFQPPKQPLYHSERVTEAEWCLCDRANQLLLGSAVCLLALRELAVRRPTSRLI